MMEAELRVQASMEEAMEEKPGDGLDEMVELVGELYRLMLQDGDWNAKYFVLDIVRRESAEQIRERIRERRAERLEGAELAKLPGYLVLEMLSFLRQEAVKADFELEVRMTYAMDPAVS
jgi:hypothetical protein